MGVGFWTKVKAGAKKIFNKVKDVFTKVVKPLASGPIGTMIQGATGIPVGTIVNGIDTGINFVDGFANGQEGNWTVNNAADKIANYTQQGLQLYDKYKKAGGIDGVLNKYSGGKWGT
jgi:hypothetical protein